MSTPKRVFVLVGDEQTPLSPRDVADVATAVGFKVAAQRFGFSETTLRAFLGDNGFVARKNVSYEKPPRDLSIPVMDAEVALGG